METPQFDPNNRPEKGAALFRWMLNKQKYDEANRSPEEKARIAEAIEKLKRENAERGTPIIRVQLPL
jgi:hypothetical protein